MSLFEGFVVVFVIVFFSLFLGFMIIGNRIAHAIENLTARDAAKELADIDSKMNK
ncbi:MAG: hypothetical protein LPK26_00700 [Bacillaceae bacterium]|uniref:DUF4083 domain-containing protein n=1 Tax=Alkalihalobacterium chitinilyticum TaxID=2980103 RepID=A0ABT5VHQ0_9BACI|nr:hypothetical protein [Alkalihalobacterium chitinilyticum]MDE5414842.1 hypothetical protein [Alkalihalobacterium chitinilyticum]MEB1805827.1 hypothetical protein [Bacillaceae bacterium]